MTTKGKKRYWRDGHQQRAKCPKCGKIGIRTMTSNGVAWMFHHGREPGPIGPQAIICIVKVENISSALPKTYAQQFASKGGKARAAKLSAARRLEISRKANEAKKGGSV